VRARGEKQARFWQKLQLWANRWPQHPDAAELGTWAQNKISERVANKLRNRQRKAAKRAEANAREMQAALDSRTVVRRQSARLEGKRKDNRRLTEHNAMNLQRDEWQEGLAVLAEDKAQRMDAQVIKQEYEQDCIELED